MGFSQEPACTPEVITCAGDGPHVGSYTGVNARRALATSSVVIWVSRPS